MKISYDSCDFSGTYAGLNKTNANLIIDWVDLLWAVMTVGKRHQRAMYTHVFYSHAEIMNRIYLLLANLRESNGFIYRSDIYNDSDPTEKVLTSFILGMAISKLFSDKLIQTPWLEHVHCLNSVLGIPVGVNGKVTKSRPDLIGRNVRGEFVIVEAKGTSRKFSNSMQKKAKDQTSVIQTINGIAPVVRVASQAYFSDNLCVYFQDPEPEENGYEVTFDENEYFDSYYHLLSNLTDETKSDLLDLGIEIKFVPQLKKAFETGDYGILKEYKVEEQFDDNGFKIFADGVMLKINEEKWQKTLDSCAK